MHYACIMQTTFQCFEKVPPGTISKRSHPWGTYTFEPALQPLFGRFSDGSNNWPLLTFDIFALCKNYSQINLIKIRHFWVSKIWGSETSEYSEIGVQLLGCPKDGYRWDEHLILRLVDEFNFGLTDGKEVILANWMFKLWRIWSKI